MFVIVPRGRGRRGRGVMVAAGDRWVEESPMSAALAKLRCPFLAGRRKAGLGESNTTFT